MAIVKDRISFWGDAVPCPNDTVLWCQDCWAICDFSECGVWVGNAHRDHKHVQVRLKDLLEFFPPETKVEAGNNGISRYFENRKIQTVADFKKWLD